MKTTIITILMLCLSGSIFAQGQLVVSKNTTLLNNIKADNQIVTRVIELKNIGNEPIILNRITPVNPKIKAEWDKQPILPNSVKKITLRFIPTDLTDNFNFKLLVYSNARNKRIEIPIHGTIIDNPAKPDLMYKYNMRGLKFKDTSMNYGTIHNDTIIKDTIHFLNTTGQNMTLGIGSKPNYITVAFYPTTVKPNGKGSIILTFNAQKVNDYGNVYASIILKYNNDNSLSNRINAFANIVENFSKLSPTERANAPVASFENTSINFGEIQYGTKAYGEFKLTNKGKKPLYIRKIKSSCGCTVPAIASKILQPNTSTYIKVTFDSDGFSGKLHKTITVTTNDPNNPIQKLHISGIIKD